MTTERISELLPFLSKYILLFLLMIALTTAYCEVAPKKLAEKIRPNQDDNSR